MNDEQRSARAELARLFGDSPTPKAPSPGIDAIGYCNARLADGLDSIMLVPLYYDALAEALRIPPDRALRQYKGVPLVVVGFDSPDEYVCNR